MNVLMCFLALPGLLLLSYLVFCACTWAVLVTGRGGRFREDVDAFMKRHAKESLSPWLLMAGLALDAGLQAIFFHRMASSMVSGGLRAGGALVQMLGRLLSGADISCHADIGGGLEIFHASGLCIGRDVKIGENAWLFQNVTIGASGRGSPVMGKGVKVFAGAVVAGGISVGDDAIIGANAVVLDDVPSGALVESPESSIRISRDKDGKAT